MARSAALAAIGLGYFDHGLELFMVGAEEHAEDFIEQLCHHELLQNARHIRR